MLIWQKILLGLIVLAGMGVVFWQITADKRPIDTTSLSDKITVIPTPEVTITTKPTIMLQKFDKLEIFDTKVGTGVAVKKGDTISINYLGTLTDGTKFDSSYDRGQPFQTQIGVGQVIAGWDEGVIGMKVGGKRTLKIPAAMGYGPRGAPPVIPPNADLIFEVELMGIK